MASMNWATTRPPTSPPRPRRDTPPGSPTLPGGRRAPQEMNPPDVPVPNWARNSPPRQRPGGSRTTAGYWSRSGTPPKWTQYGVGVGATPGITGPINIGRPIEDEFMIQNRTGLMQGSKEALPQLTEWLKNLNNQAFYNRLQEDEKATVRNMLGMYGPQLSGSYLNSVILKNNRIKANALAAMARYNPQSQTGPTKKERTSPRYTGGYGYGDYGNYYGGGGGSDWTPYKSWLTNLTNWNID